MIAVHPSYPCPDNPHAYDRVHAHDLDHHIADRCVAAVAANSGGQADDNVDEVVREHAAGHGREVQRVHGNDSQVGLVLLRDVRPEAYVWYNYFPNQSLRADHRRDHICRRRRFRRKDLRNRRSRRRSILDDS